MKGVSLKGFIKDSKVIVYKKANPYWRAFLANGYGKDHGEYIELHPVEALYLINTGKLEVLRDDETVPHDDLFMLFSRKKENLWELYTIYKDLRSKGFIILVSDDQLLPFLMLPKGSTVFDNEPFAAIMIAESFRAIKLEELAKAVEKCKEKNRKLIIAIMDEIGDITYYIAEVEEKLETEVTLKIFRKGG
ncbi:MAG: tRNA-intron lyase [Candidatus Njordarchaeales archaeon]